MQEMLFWSNHKISLRLYLPRRYVSGFYFGFLCTNVYSKNIGKLQLLRIATLSVSLTQCCFGYSFYNMLMN